MKRTLLLLSIVLTSCSTPEQNARLGQLVNLAVTVAEKRGAISPDDAQAIRDAKTIVLPDTVAAEPVPSGK